MSQFPHPPRATPHLQNEEEEARELDAFFSQLTPADAAAAQWHTRQEQGLTPSEQHEFDQWLHADAAHQAAYARLDRGMAPLRAMSPQQRDRLRAASQAAEKVQPLPRPSHPAGRQQRGGWFSWVMPRPAMMALYCTVLISLGIGWYHWLHAPTFTSTYLTARGQRLDLTLPDGSEMALDADTEAAVVLYRDRREVRLAHGQIMFHVAPDHARPFRVDAGAARVTVVGTRFLVSYRGDATDQRATRVAVEEGKVKVEGAPSVQLALAELGAGQSVRISADGRLDPVAAIPASSIALWRKGLVHFDGATLADALSELAHYGATGLVIRDPNVAAMRIGGSYQIGRPDEFIRILPKILPVRVTATEDGQHEIVPAQ